MSRLTDYQDALFETPPPPPPSPFLSDPGDPSTPTGGSGGAGVGDKRYVAMQFADGWYAVDLQSGSKVGGPYRTQGIADTAIERGTTEGKTVSLGPFGSFGNERFVPGDVGTEAEEPQGPVGADYAFGEYGIPNTSVDASTRINQRTGAVDVYNPASGRWETVTQGIVTGGGGVYPEDSNRFTLQKTDDGRVFLFDKYGQGEPQDITAGVRDPLGLGGISVSGGTGAPKLTLEQQQAQNRAERERLQQGAIDYARDMAAANPELVADGDKVIDTRTGATWQIGYSKQYGYEPQQIQVNQAAVRARFTQPSGGSELPNVADTAAVQGGLPAMVAAFRQAHPELGADYRPSFEQLTAFFDQQPGAGVSSISFNPDPNRARNLAALADTGGRFRYEDFSQGGRELTPATRAQNLEDRFGDARLPRAYQNELGQVITPDLATAPRFLTETERNLYDRSPELFGGGFTATGQAGGEELPSSSAIPFDPSDPTQAQRIAAAVQGGTTAELQGRDRLALAKAQQLAQQTAGPGQTPEERAALERQNLGTLQTAYSAFAAGDQEAARRLLAGLGTTRIDGYLDQLGVFGQDRRQFLSLQQDRGRGNFWTGQQLVERSAAGAPPPITFTPTTPREEDDAMQRLQRPRRDLPPEPAPELPGPAIAEPPDKTYRVYGFNRGGTITGSRDAYQPLRFGRRQLDVGNREVLGVDAGSGKPLFALNEGRDGLGGEIVPERLTIEPVEGALGGPRRPRRVINPRKALELMLG